MSKLVLPHQWVKCREDIDHCYRGFNLIKEKIMDLDYYEEYLTSISNEILLWKS